MRCVRNEDGIVSVTFVVKSNQGSIRIIVLPLGEQPPKKRFSTAPPSKTIYTTRQTHAHQYINDTTYFSSSGRTCSFKSLARAQQKGQPMDLPSAITAL
jgi:hypothetical protein